MEKRWKSRPSPAPTSITEISRRYVACAVALAKAMGVPLTEAFFKDHRESISCCFIESGRAGVRLRAGVALPPLTEAPVVQGNGHQPETVGVSPMTVGRDLRGATNVALDGAVEATLGDDAATNVAPGEPEAEQEDALPTTIPSGLPCAGQTISALKPAQLAMLLSKVATLVHAEGVTWVSLLGSLQSERAKRLDAGRRVTVEREPGEEG